MTVFNKAAIIGVGLIGGSLALAAREKGLFNHIIGIGRTPDNIRKAKELGVIDDYTVDLTQGVKDADLVIIATPVGTIVSLIEKMLPYLKKGAIITDVGSVKEEITNRVDDFHLSTVNFVGGHPIAGTENSGVEAAFPDLFKGKKCCLTPSKQTNPSALKKIKDLWTAVGSEVILMESAVHDKTLGAVSHLPHFIAFSLVNFLNDIDQSKERIFDFSAGGLKDITRIAASHPVMWKDIALMNKTQIVDIIEKYQKELNSFKELIKKEDSNRLFQKIQKARNIQRNIIGKT